MENQGLLNGIFASIADGFLGALSAFITGLILGALNPVLASIGFPEISVGDDEA